MKFSANQAGRQLLFSEKSDAHHAPRSNYALVNRGFRSSAYATPICLSIIHANDWDQPSGHDHPGLGFGLRPIAWCMKPVDFFDIKN